MLLSEKTGADPGILKRGGTLSRPRCSVDKNYFNFQMVQNAKITLETISFLQNISITIFKFSPFFIYNESLPMKSYQFFKITTRFDKRKNTSAAVSRKTKTAKSWTLLYHRLFPLI